MGAGTKSHDRVSGFGGRPLSLILGLIVLGILTAPQPGAGFVLPTPVSRPTPTPTTLYFLGDHGVAAYTLGSSDQLTFSTLIGNNQPNAVAVGADGKIYVLNGNNYSISIYAPGANGLATPLAQIRGNKTGLLGPRGSTPGGIAVDSFGRIYVTSDQSVLVFARAANGNVAPIGRIAGAVTGLYAPEAIAVGGSRLYVANAGSGEITVYAVGSFGDVPPIAAIPTTSSESARIALDSKGNIYFTNDQGVVEVAAIKGSNTTRIANITIRGVGFEQGVIPVAVAVDPSGNILVLAEIEGGEAGVLVLPPGSNGVVTPSATLSVDRTAAGIAVDRKGNVYVANFFGGSDFSGSVTVYAQGSSGNAAPVQTITGANTGIFFGRFATVAVDAEGNLYVGSIAQHVGLGGTAVTMGSNSVMIFPPGSNGAVAPSVEISGPLTELTDVVGVAVDAANNIYALDNNAQGNLSVKSYAAGSNGDVAPLTNLSLGPSGVSSFFAVDAAGNIYIAQTARGARGPISISVYAPGSNDAAPPAAVIAGDQTELQPGTLAGLSVDAAGSIYALVLANGGCTDCASRVLVFAPGDNGNTAPERVITGGRTRLLAPVDLAVDASGNIYVGILKGGPALKVYPPRSNGNVGPKFSIPLSFIPFSAEGLTSFAVSPPATP